MMDSRMIRTTAAVLLGCCSLAMAGVFTWAGNSTGEWSDENEWTSVGCTADCYPHTTDDDAVFAECEVTVTLTESLEIDDLTLAWDSCAPFPGLVTFTTGGEDELTITADSITITGSTIITVEEFAGLVANGSVACGV